jgi:hypothetical protein
MYQLLTGIGGAMTERQHETRNGSSADRAEALAALRKALGLERLLGLLRSDGDAPVATMRPRTRRAPVPPQDHTNAAA